MRARTRAGARRAGPPRPRSRARADARRVRGGQHCGRASVWASWLVQVRINRQTSAGGQGLKGGRLLLIDTSWQRAVGRIATLSTGYRRKKTMLEAIVVMLWQHRRLNLSTVVLPIGHAFSWLIRRKNELGVE